MGVLFISRGRHVDDEKLRGAVVVADGHSMRDGMHMRVISIIYGCVIIVMRRSYLEGFGFKGGFWNSQ